jgi:hypothetical protein
MIAICSHCGKEFHSYDALRNVCSEECITAIVYGRKR